MDAGRLLEGLDESQRAAVTTPGGPVAILAGPGSGKTRALTHRIAWRCLTGDAGAGHVLALTFTRRAAGELRDRLGAFELDILPTAGTFHAVAWAQLRARWADNGATPPGLLARRTGFVADLLRDQRRPAGTHPGDLVGEIEWAKARMVNPTRYEAAVAADGRTPPLPPAQVAEWYARYEREKRKRRLVDFDDILATCAREVESDPGFAAVVRWRFRHLFVDEFQDVNPLQHRLLEAWRGGRGDLCVVGDPNQAIYAWNGADARYLAEVAEHYPGVTVVRLTHNYRSSPQVVAAADALLGAHGHTPTAAITHRPDGPAPTARAWPDERAEMEGIVAALRARPRTAWGDCAVLVRTNALAALAADALRRAGIPYQVRGAAIADSPAVRDWLAAARRRGGPLAVHLADLRSELGWAPPGADPAPDDPVPDDPAPDGRPGEPTSHAALAALVGLAREHLDAFPGADVESFASWLASSPRADDAGGTGVDVVTFHAAKGLEWPVVFVAAFERGIVPIALATTPAQKAEEVRLAYVALTRAARELHLSWSERRRVGDRTTPREPSGYLTSILAASPGPAAPVATAEQGAGRVRALRAEVGHPRREAPAEAPLLAALRHWRDGVARAAAVAPHVVLADEVLARLARARPATTAEVGAVEGMSAVATARWGGAIVAVVAAGTDDTDDTDQAAARAADGSPSGGRDRPPGRRTSRSRPR